MSQFKQNLVRARSGLIFLAGLTAAFWLVFSIERWESAMTLSDNEKTSVIDLPETGVVHRQSRELSDVEMEWANIAWQYFENNYNANTGLVNSADKYPASTLWDTSSYLLGLIAAKRLDIVEQAEFDTRVSTLLNTLATMPLFEESLPNKSYNTNTVAMVTYNNDVTERGIGWSAIDIGRIMVPMNILVWHFPEHTGEVGEVLAHWDLDKVVVGGELFGTDVDEDDKTLTLQEGRLGYEEYAAKSFSLISRDVSKALDYEFNTELIDIYGVQVAADTRTPEEFGALNYVVSEPYILDGIEYGWDRYSHELTRRVFDVQHERYKRTGVLTAVSEDNIDQAPFFVYNTVFADGKAWNATTETGQDASEFRTLSTKAAIGFHALYENEYTDKLIERVAQNYDVDRGWYSGIYESNGIPNKAITANTNGIVLEALHYIQFGPMMSMSTAQGTQLAQSEED